MFEVRPNPKTGGFEVWGTDGSGRWGTFTDEALAGWHARQLDRAYERGYAAACEQEAGERWTGEGGASGR